MSADLFAEFASSTSGPSQPNRPQPEPATKPPVDPFAFLFSPSSQTASSQVSGPSAQAWPSLQQNGFGGLGNTGTSGPTANALHQPAQDTIDDDDGWGDFEEAPSATSTKPSTSILSSHGNLPGTAGDFQTQPESAVRNRIYRADTFALMSNNLVGLDDSRSVKPWQARPSWEKPSAKPPAYSGHSQIRSAQQLPVAKSKPKNSNSDVLFDADDFDGEAPDDDDEFGDFETVEAPTVHKAAVNPAPAQTAMADLLSLDFGPPAQPVTANADVTSRISTRKEPPSQLLSNLNLNAPSLSPPALYPTSPRSPSFSDRNPFPGLAVTTPVSGSFPQELKDDDGHQSPTPVTAWPVGESGQEKDGYFDAFANFPPDASEATPAASSSWDWGTADAPEPQIPPRKSSQNISHKAPAEEVTGLPPTNVPPPSILLSIFPELLEEADIKLYKPTANQAPGVKSRIYADPATLDYLRGYLVLATVAARILAGRKLRWHRDKFLAQAMTISAAGSKGGMKLAGIDKTQAAREDREAADVVGIWRDHVGKLRSAVAAANIGIQKQPVKLEPFKVLEINDHMVVSTAKMALKAPRACVVCGLKRDERVKGVDLAVEDSFGEWWVEYWGHRACRNFWLGNEEKLRSR
ncbi:unnamed protein product [Discula destructiva]